VRVLAIAALVCASLGSAAAQTPDDTAKANEIFLEGRELLTSGQTEAACNKFEESIALDPTAPGVMLNLGLCYEMLERYATSLYWFRKAQVAAAEAHLPAYEDEAKRHTIALSTKVSVIKIDASAAPPSVEIRVDNKLIAPTDYARVELDRGTHELEARAPGKETYEATFEVNAIDAGTLTIPTLVDESEYIGPDPVEPATSNLGRTILAAGFGAAGLGLCVGSPLWARSTKRAFDQAVANGAMPSYSTARNKQHIASGMFVLGLGAIGVATYVYLTMPSARATPTTAIVPVLDGQQVGIAISGAL
jgi:hypothetical protein